MYKTIFSQIQSTDSTPSLQQSDMLHDANVCMTSAENLQGNKDTLGVAKSLLQAAIRNTEGSHKKVGGIFDKLRQAYEKLLVTSPLNGTDHHQALKQFAETHRGCMARVLALRNESPDAKEVTSMEEFESDDSIQIM